MFTSSFKNFLTGLAIFAVLVLVFEAMVMFVPDEIVTDVAQQSGMRIKNERSLRPGNLDVIVLGDCFFFAGVVPGIIDQRLNVRSFNFAVNRVQTYMMSYVLLKNLVNHAEKPPRLVILGVHASSLFLPLEMDIDILRKTVLPFFSVTEELLDELPAKLKARVLWHHWLTKIPSLRKQFLFKGNWLHTIRHFDRTRYLRMEENLKEGKGFFNEDWTGQRMNFRVDFNLPAEDTSIREYNDRYIRKILELASQHGIKVALVSNSYRNDLARRVNYNIMFDVEYLEKLRSAYPCVIGVLNMHDVVPDPNRYVDITHLDGQGAEIFTEELARRVKSLNW